MQALMRPGGALHIRIDGPKGAPGLLMLNSLGTDLRLWDPLMPHLSGLPRNPLRQAGARAVGPVGRHDHRRPCRRCGRCYRGCGRAGHAGRLLDWRADRAAGRGGPAGPGARAGPVEQRREAGHRRRLAPTHCRGRGWRHRLDRRRRDGALVRGTLPRLAGARAVAQHAGPHRQRWLHRRLPRAGRR